MHKLRLLICYILLYTIFLTLFCSSYFYTVEAKAIEVEAVASADNDYIWSYYPDSISASNTNTNTSTNSVDLALESGSAILVEQTTRTDFI